MQRERGRESGKQEREVNQRGASRQTIMSMKEREKIIPPNQTKKRDMSQTIKRLHSSRIQE